MKLLHASVAGLDVHKETVVACARVQSRSGTSHDVGTFPTTTAGLLQLSECWPKRAVRTRSWSRRVCSLSNTPLEDAHPPREASAGSRVFTLRIDTFATRHTGAPSSRRPTLSMRDGRRSAGSIASRRRSARGARRGVHVTTGAGVLSRRESTAGEAAELDPGRSGKDDELVSTRGAYRRRCAGAPLVGPTASRSLPCGRAQRPSAPGFTRDRARWTEVDEADPDVSMVGSRADGLDRRRGRDLRRSDDHRASRFSAAAHQSALHDGEARPLSIMAVPTDCREADAHALSAKDTR
jgi:hypothetical protein